MNRSNKISFFYIVSSLLLFFALIGGGVYGAYVSIGYNYFRSSVGGLQNETFGGAGFASNVSYSNNGVAPASVSTTGVVVLSVALLEKNYLLD